MLDALCRITHAERSTSTGISVILTQDTLSYEPLSFLSIESDTMVCYTASPDGESISHSTYERGNNVRVWQLLRKSRPV
jgi:hypothetical protein